MEHSLSWLKRGRRVNLSSQQSNMLYVTGSRHFSAQNPFSRVGFFMGRLPEGAHELSCDEFPCAWACGAAGGVLGRVEEADLVLEAAASPGDEGCSREQRGTQMRGVLASPIPGPVRFAQANGGLLLDAPA